MQTEIEGITKKRVKEQPPKNCEHCKKEFIPKNSRAKYCSGTCNANASKVRTAMNFGAMSGLGSAAAQMQPMGGVFAIPPHAQMMINHHENEAKRWEKKYDDEVEKHGNTKKKIETLQEEIKSIERPSGLQGFMSTMSENSEVVTEALKHFGPVLAGLFGKAVTPGTQPQLTGGNEDPYGPSFGKWMASLRPETQNNISNLITQLAEIGVADEAKMNEMVLQILQ